MLVKRIDVASYFSALKLFEYMATGKIIIASNLKVYNKILKNNHNSITLDPKNIGKWIKTINEIFKSNKYNYLGIVLFVGIPLPFTGAWTGCLASHLLGLDAKKTMLSILI